VRRVATMMGVVLLVAASCGYGGNATGVLEDGGVAGGGLVPDGAADPTYPLGDGAPIIADGAAGDGSPGAGDGGPPICPKGGAFCPSLNTCIGKDCANNSDCATQTNTCWTCTATGAGPPRLICSAVACGNSGCACKTSMDCPPDELCAGGTCIACDAAHIGVACKKDKCLMCPGGGFICAPDTTGC
jgi:hypothetical protein